MSVWDSQLTNPRRAAWSTRGRSTTSRLALHLLVASLLACGDGGSGDSTTASGSSSGPEPGPCDPKTCDVGADCCRDEQDGPLAPNCPGTSYPNNWSCVAGECVHGGCTVNSSDCDIVPGMVCLEIAGKGQCVVPCTTDTDCVTIGHMTGATCSGMSDLPNPQSFCIQPLP
jgi:hypothetical protein